MYENVATASPATAATPTAALDTVATGVGASSVVPTGLDIVSDSSPESKE